jgi:hypothetical protein
MDGRRWVSAGLSERGALALITTLVAIESARMLEEPRPTEQSPPSRRSFYWLRWCRASPASVAALPAARSPTSGSIPCKP